MNANFILLSLQTLTRNVFVCTASAGIRAFSLSTGKEIENSCFPFCASVPAGEKVKMKGPFVHTLFQMCPSQRFFVCKGDKTMNYLLMYRFEDTGVRADGLSLHEDRTEAEKCISPGRLDVLKKFSVSTTERVVVTEKDQARVQSEQLYEQYMVCYFHIDQLVLFHFSWAISFCSSFV